MKQIILTILYFVLTISSPPFPRESSSRENTSWLLASPAYSQNLPNTLVRLQNRLKPDNYLHIERGPLEVGTIDASWWSAQWTLEKVVDFDAYKIKNRWKPAYFIHAERGLIEAGPIESNWWSAQWIFEIVVGTNFYKIKNRSKNHYLHVQSGKLEFVATVKPEWLSAQWAATDANKPSAGIASDITTIESVNDGKWAAKQMTLFKTPEAELMVRVGDIDNLGFGWPIGFNPFSGRNTPIHSYPWSIDSADPEGTDRIMVISSYRGLPPHGQDGYVGSTRRPQNNIKPIVLNFPADSILVKAAILQMFVDDFQSPVWKSRFEARFDGTRIAFVEEVLNALQQTGPIGKLVSIRILPEFLHLLKDGKLEIYIDDTQTGAGDGFAIDFVKLLINPKDLSYWGTIRGMVTDGATKRTLRSALISAGGVAEIETDANGTFELKNIPAGLVVLQASKLGFDRQAKNLDLAANESKVVNFELVPRAPETKGTIAAELDRTGRAMLYGIYFDFDSATLKPESMRTLNEILQLLRERPNLNLIIEGHTDSTGTEKYNLDLSQRRSQSVVNWLLEHQINRSRVVPKGHGEAEPISSNNTEAGRALNRRVQISEMR
jgi:outer membrane protein OmpA-like peptidoglycan-associated protein